VRFSDLKKNCWDPEPGVVDISMIEHIQIHFVSNANSSWGGTHCLSNLQALGPATPGKALRPHAGWIDGSTNTIGVEGAAYTTVDSAGSTISPDDFSGFGSPLCVKGTVAQVDEFCEEDDCWGYYWEIGRAHV